LLLFLDIVEIEALRPCAWRREDCLGQKSPVFMVMNKGEVLDERIAQRFVPPPRLFWA
jgi:hypothetical protein